MVNVMPRVALMMDIKLDWTVEKFFSAGGSEGFIGRLSTAIEVD